VVRSIDDHPERAGSCRATQKRDCSGTLSRAARGSGCSGGTRRRRDQRASQPVALRQHPALRAGVRRMRTDPRIRRPGQRRALPGRSAQSSRTSPLRRPGSSLGDATGWPLAGARSLAAAGGSERRPGDAFRPAHPRRRLLVELGVFASTAGVPPAVSARVSRAGSFAKEPSIQRDGFMGPLIWVFGSGSTSPGRFSPSPKENARRCRRAFR
jgi:hypothetical protein